MEEEVILVDSIDHPIGTMGKMEAHIKGVLHRAFSVFIFNSQGELLLQQRAASKYHSGGLWTNTCCSHQRQGESTIEAATRRLNEEMGMQCEMKVMFNFMYHAHLDRGLIEHEFDHVLFGTTNDIPSPDPNEVQNWKYITMEALANDIRTSPENYTIWLKDCFNKVYQHYENQIQ